MKQFFVALFICMTGIVLFSMQALALPEVTGDAPTVTMNAHGCPVLKLTVQQQNAVTKFLQTHPQFEMYDYPQSAYADGSCLDTYQQWKMSYDDKSVAQYPFAVWADFNHDGYLDLAVFFKTKKPVVTHKYQMASGISYTYEYDWLAVVLQGAKSGAFTPVIAGRFRLAGWLDGVVYHLGRKQIEYWCKSAGGTIRWNGSSYILKSHIGD